MRTWRSPIEVPADLGRTAVTIGNFDGMHRGHLRVLEETRRAARERGGLPVVAVTFWPHPLTVLRPEQAPLALTTLDQRAELLARAGVDALLVVPFDRQLAAWSPRRFVEALLVDTLHCAVVVVGANFRFGHRAAGDVATLTELGHEHGFDVTAVAIQGGEQPWSSTLARTALAAGDVESAAEVLGRPFAVRGVVVEGDRRGRALGYPTANVPAAGLCAVPPDGVYAGWLRRVDDPQSARLPAAISVGSNPTFSGADRRVEAYVLDRDDLDLYGVEVEVAFVARLRAMQRFDSVDALLDRMAEDVRRTREYVDWDERAAR